MKTRARFSFPCACPTARRMDRTDAASHKIEDAVRKIPGVEKTFVFGGTDIADGHRDLERCDGDRRL